MENFELTAFLKALLFMQVLVHLQAIAEGVIRSFQIFCNVFLHEVLNLIKHKPITQSKSQWFYFHIFVSRMDQQNTSPV